MRNFIFLIVITALLYSCSSDSSNFNSSKIEAEIKKNLYDQKQAWNAHDIPGFMEHYWKSDSMAFMSKNGIRYGWEETKESYEKNYSTPELMGELEFTIKELEVLSSESAYLLGAWDLKQDTTTIGGHFSLIWKKKNGKWVIVTDHTS